MLELFFKQSITQYLLLNAQQQKIRTHHYSCIKSKAALNCTLNPRVVLSFNKQNVEKKLKMRHNFNFFHQL